jgi:hypothetical protein
MNKEWDFDLVALHGAQETTDEDRAYTGSRYSEVRQALYANPYRGGTAGQEPGQVHHPQCLARHRARSQVPEGRFGTND